MKKLVVQDRYLVWEDGKPFFYLGDTAWELFHALSREEIKRRKFETSKQKNGVGSFVLTPFLYETYKGGKTLYILFYTA